METGKPMTTRLTLRRWLLLAVTCILAAPALAEPAAGLPGKRGEEPPAASEGRWRDLTPEQREFIRQRHQERDAAADREARRERWREMSPAEREQHRELHRQIRQLSAEERQQLRRDILEANRDDRRR